ncbi:MAG: MBL fold metallo-hydrolase [Gemmatimonadetes bacterium]|nr:MBL fold metallo-hydrolase [Gemmatimonadota bacterium]
MPRRHAERNWSIGEPGRVLTPAGLAVDSVPEDASLLVDTPSGLVLVTGCGHAGIVNTLEYAHEFIRPAPAHAVIGGLHLFQASEEVLRWTARKLEQMRVAHLLAGHCTGIEATYRLRALMGLDRRTAVVSAVGSSFSLGRGIDPLMLAR